MDKHHSCLNTRAVIEYFQENFPEELSRLVQGLGPEVESLPDPLAFLTEPNNWVSSEVVIRLFDNAKKLSGNDQILLKIGYYSAARKKFSYITRIILFAYRNPRRSLKRIQAINDKFNKNKTIEVVKTTRDSAVIRLHWFREIPATKDFCLFNQGVYTGLPTVWDLPPATVQETKCFFDGDEYCEYHCKWQIKPLFKTLTHLLTPWRALRLSLEEMEQDKETLRQKFDEVHKLYLQLQKTNRELEQANIELNVKQELLQQNIHEINRLNIQLQDRNLELKEKINKLECLQDTGSKILAVLDRDELFQVTLRALRNYARLHRAGIFLVDGKSRMLRFGHAVGVDEATQRRLQDYQLPLSKVDNLIVRVYNSGNAVIINDVSASNLNKANPLLQLFQPRAIIVAPLTSQGMVSGVLLADRRPEDGYFTASDKDFIVSFANQIAIAWANAELIRQKDESERHLRRMFENAQVGILKINAQNLIQEANPRMKALCGAEELRGQHIYDFLDADNQKKFQKIIAANRAGQPSQAELEILSKNQPAVTVLLSSVPTFDEDRRYTGCEAIVTDLSETKKMQRQLIQSSKMEALGTMAGGFAHEFKNILQAIKLWTEGALADLPQDSEVYTNLTRVLQSINKGTDTVHQILLFCRDQKPELKPIRLRDIIEDGLKMVRAALPTSIIIQADIDPNAGFIMGDGVRMHQVLLNLCTNAAHAMRDKIGCLTVSLQNIQVEPGMTGRWQHVKPGPYVQLTVQDNGIGMDRQTMERIFEPFFTTKEQGEGTGMGLSTVHGIVEDHGGSIDVESAPGAGTTFHILFPRCAPQELEPELPRGEPPQPTIMPTGTERILFVDDELTLTEIVKKMLERLGYEVVAKSSSREALDLFLAQPEMFDLVIADQTMPHMTGVALAHEISRIRPDLPIILCTGMIDSQKLDKKAAGIREILTKPVTISKLAEVVRQTLDSQHVPLH
ncbi:MAG: ATP-binding protein [Desulfobacca sp.]|uniref:ATP-binding protein n=1 Tax=Desulfobacca sp. TaxID=2067990 RepID=UPI00404AA6A7